MKTLEWLRPIVETMAWDYCIVWQFGDDPSRYIEWIGCCCNGSRGVCRNVKEEIDATKQPFPELCRDTYIKHSLKTKTCQKLAKIPFYLPLYSGIHGEVSMSGQPAWNHVISTDHTIGTQVLIPVAGGLIELYKSKQVPRDQKMIDSLMTRFNIFSKHTMNTKTEIEYTKTKQKPSKEQCQSKNLVTERNRRNKIKDGLFALRALVPKISKMDRVSIVGDAVEYIKELQLNVQELQDELKRLEEDEDETEVCKPKRGYEDSDTKPEVQVDVHQIGAKDFLIKINCTQKQGGVSRVLEIVDSLGLKVVAIDVTTCNDRVLNFLQVEAKGKDVAATSLKDSLVKSWMSFMLKENPRRIC